ncbi:MAG: hypothetical protein PUF82_00430 [Lactobacillus equicursoris]|uniref:hypothetical protein n=1 Tax=Lactobacillus equicursoris TaxID=420645 RepID=UPI002431B91A|nr:hypothetical protein [Lactobacillus equicursoris]MDD6406470.1 hypothetical protein [Lactobacillus equicursoris]
MSKKNPAFGQDFLLGGAVAGCCCECRHGVAPKVCQPVWILVEIAPKVCQPV